MTEVLCVCKNCPNMERCIHYIDNTHIKQFPAIYVVTDMSSTCHWYKETQESDKEFSQDWFTSLPTIDKEKLFKYISEKCQKCGEQNDKRYKR